ncbi:MAG TPA: hypothetical protein VGH48_04920 [Caldimonas sp.]
MADEIEDVTVHQPDGQSFRVQHEGTLTAQHEGTLRVRGDSRADPMHHRVGAELGSAPDRPLVHMVLWDEQGAEVNARLTVAGDPEKPLHAQVRAQLHHRFEDEHRQLHRVETALSHPIHHALQMRTPLQVRFCNSWQIASDYTIEIRLGDNRLIGVRLTGATIAKPLPCDDVQPCDPPVITHAMHP